jgi:hypothetical protein
MIDSVGPEEKWRLQPLLDSGLNNSSVRRHDSEVHLVHRTLGRLRETTPARTAPGSVRNSCALSAPELDAVKGGHEVSAISATCSLVTVLGTSFSSVWHQPAKGKLVKRKRGIRYTQWSGSSDQCCLGRCWTRFHAATFVLF